MNLNHPFVHCINKNSIRGATAAPARICLKASRRIRSVYKKVIPNISMQVVQFISTLVSLFHVFFLSTCLWINWLSLNHSWSLTTSISLPCVIVFFHFFSTSLQQAFPIVSNSKSNYLGLMRGACFLHKHFLFFYKIFCCCWHRVRIEDWLLRVNMVS